MNNMNNKTIYSIGGVIVGLTFTYFGYNIYRAYRNKKLAEQGEIINVGAIEGNVGSGQQASKDPKPSKDSLPLRIGDYGYNVAILQSALNSLGASLFVDGKFGEKTYDAISENTNEWNLTCKIGYFCSLNTDEYNSILKKAKKEGWNQKIANDEVSEDWLKFVDGDNYVFNKVFN